MRLIIAGSRTAKNYNDLIQALQVSGFDKQVKEILCGGAKGADELGASYANTNHIPLRMFPADWNTHGKSAGFIRNIEMADNADALLALWDGKSRGTDHMIKTAMKKNLTVYVWNIE